MKFQHLAEQNKLKQLFLNAKEKGEKKKDKSHYDFYGGFYRYVDDGDGKQELESLGKNTGLMEYKRDDHNCNELT